MRKFSLFLSTLVLAAMVLAACGGGATSTNVVESPPPVTVDVTEDISGTATEAPTDAGTMTETPGVPVTGEVDPARVSNQLDFTVWSQDGEQIGEVEDMLLDMDNTQVTYVLVGTGGFLDLGEREILVPWESLELQTGTGDATGGQQNAFILQTDVDTFSNVPDFDLGTLPQMGQPATDWDADIRNYWEGGSTGPDSTANTPEAGAGTATGDTTATVDPAVQATATVGTTDQATATTDPGTGAGTGQGQGQPLQGVLLASEVLGSTINWGAQGQGTGTGQGTGSDQATATTDPAAGGTAGTATADPNAQPTATAGTDAGTDQGNTTGTIEDIITDTATGDILYVVITAAFEEGERWIPVPLSQFQWNGAAGAFNLNADTTVLQNAPSFQDGQFPDTSAAGWNAEIDTFWQNNGGTGTGTETQATPTP